MAVAPVVVIGVGYGGLVVATRVSPVFATDGSIRSRRPGFDPSPDDDR